MTTVKSTDEIIKANVVDHLCWDNRVDASNIKVTVNDREVTLTGEVPAYAASIAAASDARSVMDVTVVNNNLTVNLPSIPSDEDLKANIKSRLFLNPYLLSYKFDVNVRNGWVTIDGTVDAYWKKLEAEHEASNIRGVTGITNKIVIVTTEDEDEKPVDEAIAEDVVKAIARNRKVDVNDVNVKVEDGNVILTGSVPSWEARGAAYNSALYTFGVTHVKDKLAIAAPAA
ncbi:MAG: BON domain-containing protein [Anaerolineae bacterium]|nr:BON domain-containing protein [Anaerolineae bacterium]